MKNMFKYYLSNKRRGISLIFVMALTVFSIYFVTSLVQSIFSTVEYSNIACLNDFSFVYPVGGSSFLQNETVEKIKNDDSVGNAYPILLEYTVINNIFGTTSGYVAFMDEADIGEIFDDFSLSVFLIRKRYIIKNFFPTRKVPVKIRTPHSVYQMTHLKKWFFWFSRQYILNQYSLHPAFPYLISIMAIKSFFANFNIVTRMVTTTKTAITMIV